MKATAPNRIAMTPRKAMSHQLRASAALMASRRATPTSGTPDGDVAVGPEFGVGLLVMAELRTWQP